MNQKQGILLINLGTPATPEPQSVRRYLRAFLADKRVIPLSPILWRPILELFILPRRPYTSAKMYQSIWSAEYGSPLEYYTKRQAELLQKKCPEAKVRYAFSYSDPQLTTALEAFAAEEVTDLTLIPLYPQYSTTTVGSVSDEIMRFYQGKNYQPNLKMLTSFSERSEYLELLATKIEEQTKKADYDCVILSYHGIPQSYVKKGDPYEKQCCLMTKMLKERLPELTFLQCYQSKFGPAKWLDPALDKTLQALPEKGYKKVLVVSASFVSDCLETLFELEIENRQKFMAAGGKKFDVLACLNDDASWIELLAKWSKR